MTQSFIERIDAAGASLPLPAGGVPAALAEGEALHRDFRPEIGPDYAVHMQAMATEGARILQLVDDGEVRAIAVWRSYLMTYVGRRMEIDDLVTAEGHRSNGYGATLLTALEGRARALGCQAVMLTSATKRIDAHRFYFRQRYAIVAFQFAKRA